MRRGFTLIELLVAVAIIALLVGILVPTLVAARDSARRGVCLANLKGIGVGVQLYYGESDLLPGVLDITDPNQDQGTPDLLEVLAEYVDTPAPVRERPEDEASAWVAADVWTCPADRDSRFIPAAGRSMTFAEQFGASHEYDLGGNLLYIEGFIRPDLDRAQLQRLITRAYERRQWQIISDARSFHSGELPRNALYFPSMSAAEEQPVPSEDYELFEKDMGADKVWKGG
ncbi:MAG: prepilin-type N-terminal cleavage/methylation domain-containing protein [Planctomycetota bacterium]